MATVGMRLAQFKETLQLTTDQEKNWPAFESGLRELVTLRVERISDLRDQPPRTTVERLRRDAEHLGSMSTALKRLADAEEPLYNSLNEWQKERFASLTRLARRDWARLEWEARTASKHGSRGLYGRGNEHIRLGGYGDEDESWRDYRGMTRRDHMMTDEDRRWRDHRGMTRCGRMMTDDDEGWQGHHGMMNGGYMMDDDDEGRTERRWRNRDDDARFERGGWRKNSGRCMMNSCGAGYDRRDNRD